MPGPPNGRLDPYELLASVEDAPPVAAADVLGRRLETALGATGVSFLIADFSGQALIRLDRAGARDVDHRKANEAADRVPLSEGPHGRVLAAQQIECVDGEGGVRVMAPVTNRGDAIGVLELGLPQRPGDEVLADIAAAAHALAYVIVVNRRYTDFFTWGQRSVPLSLAAEIQHRLLPAAYTCEAGQFTVAGWLEPAGNNAGDTFDFSLERDTAHLSLTDAMGHDVQAAMLATVLVGALRNSRRGGAEVADQAASASAALRAHAAHGEFATGQLVRIDLGSARAAVVNAGHPRPLRMRDGRVEPIPFSADPPFGVIADHVYRVQDLPLVAGDRVFFLTDGVLERNAANLDVRSLVVETAGQHPREAVQQLMAAVSRAASGELKDDATVLCLDWHGGPQGERRTASGTDR